MFIELRVYTSDVQQFIDEFPLDDKKLQFSFHCKEALFASPEYTTSQLNYLVFHPQNNVNVIDEKVVSDLCLCISKVFDCIAEAFATLPEYYCVYYKGEKFKSLDEIEKYNQANGEDFQISYLKDAFVRAMNKERKRLAIKNISYEL